MTDEKRKSIDRMLETLKKLQSDHRLTYNEQQDIKYAWSVLYVLWGLHNTNT